MKRRHHLKKKQDFFANIPSDIIIDILSRLPVNTIIACKCVRKSWLALLETPEFVNSHFLKAAVGLALHESQPNSFTVFEFEDGPKLRCGPIIKFNLPFRNEWVVGCANGFLLLCCVGEPLIFYICNPITRDYIEIHRPHGFLYSCPRLVGVGFGVTKTNDHKVVTVIQEKKNKPYHCHVYTIGTGVWKKIAPPVRNMNSCRIAGVFLNDNLHWLVSDLNGSQPWISCFDLENEIFSSFSCPLMTGRKTLAVILCVLGDTLCLCDNRTDGIDIWLIKKFGDEISWTKQFVISNNAELFSIYPRKVFKGGDILMAWNSTNILFYYFERNKVMQDIEILELRSDTMPFLHAPNFFSLRNFTRENVRSFSDFVQ